MKKYSYSMDKLLRFQEFDAAFTMNSFKDSQAYFNKLTDFVNESGGYLKEYNPLVVKNSEEECKKFLSDIQDMIHNLSALGMKDAVMDLEKLGDMAVSKDAKILEDGILKFQCDMEIIAKRILETRIEDSSKKASDGKKVKNEKGVKIQKTPEGYLETILTVRKKQGHVRPIDVANYMNESKPNISVVMKQFRKNGYIEMDLGGYITLTEKGEEIAGRAYERHELIAEILMRIGVDEETAYRDSFHIEHSISDKSFACIKEYYQKIK